MIPEPLTPEERADLLRIARQALIEGVTHEKLIGVESSVLSDCLRQQGASFITLTIDGELRGCIGALEAYQSLAQDVAEHTVAAALEDYRFPPVCVEELTEIKIEISRLTPPVKLEYETPDDLLKLLRPCVDGVILRYS
jgi:AmmeMemoRadiSam system protein A